MRTCIYSRELLNKISQQTSSAPNRRTMVNLERSGVSPLGKRSNWGKCLPLTVNPVANLCLLSDT